MSCELFVPCTKPQSASTGRISMTEPHSGIFPVVHTPYYYDKRI